MAVPSEPTLGLPSKVAEFVIGGLSFSVFAVLDIVDQLLCPVFALLDSILDGKLTSCYCYRTALPPRLSCISPLLNSTENVSPKKENVLENWRESSTTVYATHRRAVGRTRLHLVPLHRSLSCEDANIVGEKSKIVGVSEGWSEPQSCGLSSVVENRQGIASVGRLRFGLQRWCKVWRAGNEKRLVRWSDCGCEKCVSWQANDQHLHVQVDEKDFVASAAGIDSHVQSAENNVLFLHGFLSSSSFWTDSVMPALPKHIREANRLFAVDLLGFGKSPKPSTSSYNLADHVTSIQCSVLEAHDIQKFHLVAHSMGCTVALALAAQFPSSVKSITLLAPPYFPATSGITSGGLSTMQQVAPRRVWPLITFGSAVMSWYEHIGRVVCLFICRNHRIWEPLLCFLLSKIPGHRIPLSSVTDFMQHTHHSAWHLFHNTICSGANAAEHCFGVLLKAGIGVRVIHGTRDAVIPFKQSVKLSQRYPNVLLTPVISANHASIVFGRELELGNELAEEFTYRDKYSNKEL